MSQTQGTCSYAYSSTCMTTRLQAIVASRRPSTRSDANTLGRYHAALWQALYVIMHPALILAGTINLDKSSHDFFHSHCHLPTPMIIMAQPLTSSKVASSLTSIHCVENYPVHPKEVHPHPSISTLRSTTSLLPSSHSYLPVPSMNNANVPVISIDPLYPPRRRPSPPFRL